MREMRARKKPLGKTSYSATNQIKPIAQHFPMILIIILHKVVLIFESVMKTYSVTIQMKATAQYFPMVVFIMLYKLVITFESVNEIIQCDHSN